MRTKEYNLFRLTFEDLSNRVIDEINLDTLVEKMSVAAKRRNKIMRRRPEFKRKMKKKRRCMKMYGDRIKRSNGKFTCSVEGKVIRAMKKMDKIKLRRTRKRNKARITIK